MNTYNGSYENTDYDDRITSQARENLRVSFKDSDSYLEVDKYNKDGSIDTDYPIQIWHSSNKLNNYKKFISHPDYPINYGDILDLGSSKVIVLEKNENNRISDDGMVYKCNDKLKWKYDGNDYNQDCYIDYGSLTVDEIGDSLQVQDSTIDVYTQHTDSIENIGLNTNFIFGNHFKNKYSIVSVVDSNKDGLLEIRMKQIQFSNEDDTSDNIADNLYDEEQTKVIQSGVDDSYYTISPNDGDIIKSETVNYIVEHYDVDNNLLTSNLTYQIVGVDSTVYDLVIVNNNEVDITCNKDDGIGNLVITNTDYSEDITFEINFRGLF